MNEIKRVLGGALFHVPHPQPQPQPGPHPPPGPHQGRAPGDTGATPRGRLVAVTAVSGAALFLLGVNTTGINTALRAIAADLGVGTTALGWAVGAYMLAVAALVVPGGRLGDTLGQRTTLVGGALVFAAGAAVVAAGDTEAVLITGRVLQGVGAAAVMPSTMAVLRLTWPRERQGVALGLWGAVAGLAFALGPLIGGAFTDGPSWRWLWWTGAAWALAVACVAAFALRGLPPGSGERGLDGAGLLLLSVGLTALLVALQQIPSWGAESPRTLLCFLVAVAALTLLVQVETRRPAPLLHLALLRRAPLVAACLGTAVNTLFLIGFLYFFNLYALSPETLGYSAVTASLALLPYGACAFAVSMGTGPLCDRIGYRWPVAVGIALSGAGALWLSTVGPATGYGGILPGSLVLGVGVGSTLSAPSAAGLRALDSAHSGEASGIINVVRYVTAALVVSAGTLLFLGRGSAHLERVLRRTGAPAPTGATADRLLSGATLPTGRAADTATQEALHRATAAGLAEGFGSVMFWLGVLALAAVPLWLLLIPPAPPGTPDDRT
ncbi:MFS transporter [Streptomyces sp. WAC06614]|uniref:MFS transporter n=1 Tax=Streptomyces sp. WAC06614 TaxID=2487416 RepID=UPI000F7AA154|nr:MFS transporter [Streptomyces sp. WAC06614]RSS81843.1 MFS transporter [Streptomyces sp. WAC06614]